MSASTQKQKSIQFFKNEVKLINKFQACEFY